MYSDRCTEYSGICTEHLKHLTNEVSLYTLILNGISKDDVITFVNTLKQYSEFINENCRDAVMPFLCQYFFPPCDINSGNVSYISQTQCSNIRDAVCFAEWNLVIRISPLAASLLPSCENFDDDENKISPIAPIQSLQCHSQFKDYCGLCLPLCGKFTQYQAETEYQEKSIIIFSCTEAFIGGILVLIASFHRQRAM